MANLFGVALAEENQEVVDRINLIYPNSSFGVSPTLYIIDAEEWETVDEVARRLYIHESDESPSIGVVLKLNGAYAGFFYSSLWTWLRGRE